MGASSSVLLLGLRRRGGKDRDRQRPRQRNTASANGNTPDVIEAHERYGRSCHSGLEQPVPLPAPLPQPVPAPHLRPSVSVPYVPYSYSAPGSRPRSGAGLSSLLPTQHQHPVDTPRTRSRGVQSCKETSSAPHGPHQHQHQHRGCTCPPCPGSRCCSRSRTRSSRTHSRPRLRSGRHRSSRSGFGYDIQDVDGFLAKASLESPANIPMVLARSSVLYRTREGGWQEEVPLPLGMVVNGVFLVARWLYAQTPHGHEGYVSYSACIPLGILPREGAVQGPCWDTASDVFPAPSGNRTDTDKLGGGSDLNSESIATRGGRVSEAERHLDALFLRATAAAPVSDLSMRLRPLVIVRRGSTHSEPV